MLILIAGCSIQKQIVESPTDEPVVTSTESTNVKIIMASGEWPPFCSENMLYEGIISRIAKEAFKRKDMDLDFIYQPWKKSMKDTKRGTYPMTFPWRKNEERLESFYYSEPIAYLQNVFFYRKDIDFDWETLDDLEGIIVGANQEYMVSANQAYSYGDEIDIAVESGKLIFEYASKDSLNFQKLATGKIDVLINDLDVGYHIIHNELTAEEIQSITYHPKPVTKKALYILFSKNHEGSPELLLKFNEGLKELEDSGIIEEWWEESRDGKY